MRKLIVWAFMYSLDGLLPDEGSEYWDYCFGLPQDPAMLQQKLEVYETAHSHIMGRETYEGTSQAMTTNTDHPLSELLTGAPKVVFSRSMTSADWANTAIAAGDTREEIDQLRHGGEGHIVVWGGVGFWRSLMELDLIDEWRLDLHPAVAGDGTQLFNGTPKDYRLELVTTTEFTNGVVGLHYRRDRG